MAEFSQQDLTSLREDIGELKTAFKDVAKALERLARLEERHISARDEIERSFLELAKLDTRLVISEGRISILEKEMPALRKQSHWIDKGIYGLMGMIIVYVLKKSGVL